MSNHIEIRPIVSTYTDPYPGEDADKIVLWACGRCGGTGNVGYGNVYGGVCFKCNGSQGERITVKVARQRTRAAVNRANRKERELIAKQEAHNARMEAAEARFPLLAGWFNEMEGNSFLSDLWTKAFDYDLSDKQLEAANGVFVRKQERQAARAAENADLTPAPAGKERISGTVLSVKYHEGSFGDSWKMIVKDARKFKVWVTIPSALWDALRDEAAEDHNISAEEFVGRQVAFNATIEPSEDDPTFAFAKRPTKALLQAEAAEQAPEATETAEEPTEAPTAPQEATAAAAAPAAPAGETVTHKDGTVYTFVSVSKDGLCYRVKDAHGKASYKRISHFV